MFPIVILNQKFRGKNISMHLTHFEVRQISPFDSNYLTQYSHMFYNMQCLDEELSSFHH